MEEPVKNIKKEIEYIERLVNADSIEEVKNAIDNVSYCRKCGVTLKGNEGATLCGNC